MKKIDNCEVRNCIPMPASCIDWDAGEIPFLGICNGESLPNVILELTRKVQDLSGDNLSAFDIDSLLDICGQKAPVEITISTILNAIKVNEVCLNDKIGVLAEQIAGLSETASLDVNLKCYAVADNLGNILTIDRKGFDQLVIDNLCLQKSQIEGLGGLITNLQNTVNNLSLNTTVEELTFATCINGAILPTSTQVINTSSALCTLRDATGTAADIATALAKTPAGWNATYGLTVGWNLTPANWAQAYGNLLLVIASLEADLEDIKNNCCNITCDDISLGFVAIYNEDNTGVIIRFTSGAGTSIPNGFTDLGSTGVITDVDGNTETFSIDIVDNFSGNETEVPISALNLTGDLEISITAKIGTEGLTCEKCLHKVVKKATCAYCEICASGEDGSSIVITYEEVVLAP